MIGDASCPAIIVRDNRRAHPIPAVPIGDLTIPPFIITAKRPWLPGSEDLTGAGAFAVVCPEQHTAHIQTAARFINGCLIIEPERTLEAVLARMANQRDSGEVLQTMSTDWGRANARSSTSGAKTATSGT